MFYTRISCLTALCICLLTQVRSQSMGDYVVTVQYDTLYGEVKLNSYSPLNETVLLKDGQKKKTTFTPNKARAFKIKEKLYHSVLLKDHYVFMQALVPGYMSLYEHQTSSSTSAATEINTYLKINMGELVQVPKIGFRKKVAPLLSQCPTVYQKVEDRTYDFTDLEAMAREYNQCVARQPQAPPVQAVVPAPSETRETPVNATVGALLTYLEQNPQAANRDDLRTLLQDIAAKQKAGAAVPKYLLEALVNLSKPTEAISEQALRLATELGYQAGK